MLFGQVCDEGRTAGERSHCDSERLFQRVQSFEGSGNGRIYQTGSGDDGDRRFHPEGGRISDSDRDRGDGSG